MLCLIFAVESFQFLDCASPFLGLTPDVDPVDLFFRVALDNLDNVLGGIGFWCARGAVLAEVVENFGGVFSGCVLLEQECPEEEGQDLLSPK